MEQKGGGGELDADDRDHARSADYREAPAQPTRGAPAAGRGKSLLRNPWFVSVVAGIAVVVIAFPYNHFQTNRRVLSIGEGRVLNDVLYKLIDLRCQRPAKEDDFDTQRDASAGLADYSSCMFEFVVRNERNERASPAADVIVFVDEDRYPIDLPDWPDLFPSEKANHSLSVVIPLNSSPTRLVVNASVLDTPLLMFYWPFETNRIEYDLR